MRLLITLLVWIFVIMSVASMMPAHARTWLIAPDGSGECPSIQAGVDSAAVGDTLLLTAGTFTGPGNRLIGFNGKDFVLTSQAGPASTIIDGESISRSNL